MAIAFIGGGNMATALIGGMLARGAAVDEFRVVEPLAEARARIAGRFPGIALFGESTREAVAGAALVVLAVKPQQMRAGGAAPSRRILPASPRRSCFRSPPGSASPISRAGCTGTAGSSGRCRILRRSWARASRAHLPRRPWTRRAARSFLPCSPPRASRSGSRAKRCSTPSPAFRAADRRTCSTFSRRSRRPRAIWASPRRTRAGSRTPRSPGPSRWPRRARWSPRCCARR